MPKKQEKNKLRFLTIFPEAENVHLIKDVGMIPFVLHRTCGYEATLACYKNGEYPYLNTELDGLKIVFMKRIFGNTFLDGLWFLLLQHNNFDVVQTYHFRFRSLFWLFAFKLFGSKKISFLKLDANASLLNHRFKIGLALINKLLLKNVDLISVETKFLQEKLSEKWQRKILLIPNGFYKTEQNIVPFQHKKDVIITVGRIGLPEKRTDFLMEAFAQFSPAFPNWTLQLIGPIEPAFLTFKNNFFEKHPQLLDKIIFTGAIENRETLYAQYAEAKVFCLPSSSEGFPLAMIEAAFAGCYLISSNFLSAADITDNEKYGRILPGKNDDELVQALKDIVGMNDELLEKNCIAVQHFANQHFSWANIASFINVRIKKRNEY